MRRSIFPYLVKKFCLGLLMVMCITSIMVFPASASAEAATVDLEDGEYSIEVILEGGSGRATITSPAIMTVRGGKGYVQIEWSSPNYDYMKVENKTFKPLQEAGNSTFELPIIDFDMPIAVVANTTAMSTPHEIEYTLTFLQDTIKQDTSFEMMAMVAGTVIVIAIVVIITFFGIHKKRRSK